MKVVDRKDAPLSLFKVHYFMPQAGEPFMMLNVDLEAFASASGSIACESLPPELQKEYQEGESEVNSRQFTVNVDIFFGHNILWDKFLCG